MRVAMAAVLLLSTAACQKPETKAVVPEVFRVKFQTSEGDFIVETSRAWAPPIAFTSCQHALLR